MTTDKIVQHLNDLLASNPEVTNELFAARFEIDNFEQLDDSPFIFLTVKTKEERIFQLLGPLGLLNGILDPMIVMTMDTETNTIVKFSVNKEVSE